MKIEDSLMEFVKSIVNEEIKELKEEIKELRRQYGEGKTWMNINEVEQKFGIRKRTLYRKMQNNEYQWKKINGGKRVIDVRSLWVE